MEANTDLVARLYERWNERDLEGEGRDGVQVRREGAHLVTLRDGLAVRIEVHGSWDSARAAAQQGR